MHLKRKLKIINFLKNLQMFAKSIFNVSDIFREKTVLA